MRTTFTIAALAAVIALVPAAAQAATECQSAQAAGSAFDAAGAWEAWKDNVADTYGPAWAKLDLAQSKAVVPLTIPSFSGPITTYFAYAVPCRTVRITAGLVENFGNLELVQEEPAPQVHGNFKKMKLSANFQ